MYSTVLITGVAGFIGSHLSRSLLTDGFRVIGIDNESTGRRENIAELLDNPNFQYVCADAGDESILSELVQEADYVYHLAATVGVALVASDPIRTIQTNIDLTGTLLRVLEKRNRIRPVKLYFASTSEVYGRNPARIWSEENELVYGPTTIGRWSYGLSKAIDEHLVLAYGRQFGLPAVIGRFFNVVGARQTGQYGMVLPRFVSAAMKNDPITVYDDGLQRRCFIHVSDVVTIIRKLLLDCNNNGQIYNIGSSESISILDLAQKVIAQTGSKSEIVFKASSDVYGKDFEDCRWRMPNVSKLFATIDYRPQFTLADAINDIIRSIDDKTIPVNISKSSQSRQHKDCDTLLVPIKPELVQRILSGEKKYEYRKSIPSIPIKRLVIYATAPIQRVVAIAEVSAVRQNTLKAIWEGTKEGAGVSEEVYYEYFANRSKAFAFKLGKIDIITPPAILKEVDSSLAIPQSYSILTPEQTQRFCQLVK